MILLGRVPEPPDRLGRIRGQTPSVAKHAAQVVLGMGEVLRGDAQMPQTILGEHVAILNAIIAGDGAEAEQLGRDHITQAAKVFVERLQAQKAASEEELRQRPTRRIR